MDSDQLSIASDFSVIPESMVNFEDMEQSPAPMCVSFFQSSTSGAASQCDKVAVTFGHVNKVGIEPNLSLSVVFWFSDQFKPKSSDRIALYKVGFSSTKDFLCYKWVPVPSGSADTFEPHRSYTVDFEADLLPDDLDGFYQICYLMKSGNILGVSTTFTLKQAETEVTTNEVEEAARNVLSVRIRELVKENTELGEKLEETKKEFDRIKTLYEESEMKYESCAADRDECKILINNLKETTEEAENEIEKLKMEVLIQEEAVKKENLLTQEMQGRLTETVLTLNEMKGRLASNIEDKSISDERHQVLIEDNQDLKENLRLVKDELETAMKEKAAAEKIASDLSQELQTSRSEYLELGLVNLKLTKKIKKLRRVIALMEAANNDDFICVEEDSEERREEEEDKLEEGVMSASMSASHASGVISQCPSSTCSQKLSESVVSVQKTMEVIVHQLNEQTEEMKSLKREISRKALEGTQPSPPASQREASLSTSSSVEQEDSRVIVEGKKEETHSTEDKVLYEHCFLPAHCTAPVFLPARKESPKKVAVTPKPVPRSNAPSAPSPTPSMMENEAVELPRPLRPVKTDTARNAAVLYRFADNNSLQLDGVVQQPRSQNAKMEQCTPKPAAHQPESDDEDYHSTGDAGEQNNTPNITLPSSLKCPMCPLEFLPTALRLMDEHINNHLDRICPICSNCYPRNTTQKQFETHVQSHFENENDIPEDPTGPWDPRDTDRSFQLLEID